ncbi:RimK/LysX family protein [Methanolobus halotolerans]|uniref:Uncharacterized protein n=1 Tax=Methanolobus halotolerans TaxID=2052935 RepID=A0A4E0PYR9_9EURY|nr:RimK/LysX family protein [Methanolobus halotolerans]TGC10689.1 hypothetical protein CUN85_04230 [Methanolobus halotolerans]
MKVSDLRSMLVFNAREEAIFSKFDLPRDAFYPMLLSLKIGGAWSYSAEHLKSISVMRVYTPYDQETKTGNTVEDIYLLIDPEVVAKEGNVNRLEKCGNMDARVLLTRPHSITLRARKILMASVSTEKKKISIRETTENVVMFTGPSAYYAAHEMEHLENTEVKGLPMWSFEYVVPDNEKDQDQ